MDDGSTLFSTGRSLIKEINEKKRSFLDNAKKKTKKKKFRVKIICTYLNNVYNGRRCTVTRVLLCLSSIDDTYRVCHLKISPRGERFGK